LLQCVSVIIINVINLDFSLETISSFHSFSVKFSSSVVWRWLVRQPETHPACDACGVQHYGKSLPEGLHLIWAKSLQTSRSVIWKRKAGFHFLFINKKDIWPVNKRLLNNSQTFTSDSPAQPGVTLEKLVC